MEWAAAFYRKGAAERVALDAFTTQYAALELLNKPIKERYGLPDEETVLGRVCPKCGEPTLTRPTSGGIKHALVSSGGSDLWTKANDARNAVLHGRSSALVDVLAEMPTLARQTSIAARAAVLDLLGVVGEILPKMKRSTMGIPLEHRTEIECTFDELDFDSIRDGEPYPRLEQVRTADGTRREIVDGRLFQTGRLEYKPADYLGTWSNISLRVAAAHDPDDPNASLRVNIA